ncbi:MAG: complex I subunit 5 family protein [Candidatus Bathyarchaeia archaeon]
MLTKPLDVLVVFTVTTPLVGWIAQKFAYRKLQNIYATLGLSISAYFLYELYKDVTEKRIIHIEQSPYILSLSACLEIDMLGVFMAAVIVMLGIFAAVYSFKYMERDTGLTEFHTLLLGMIAGMVGVVFAGDFFTLYVFWELMCLTSYTLVAFRKHSWEPLEAGFKYLIMSATGAVTILLAMSFLYGMTGTLNFASLAASLREVAPNEWLFLTLILIIVGFGINAAIVPFHTWLPDAHPAAPAPISAMLSGIMIETAVYALSRVLFLVFQSSQIHWGTVIAILSVVTMTGGNIMALLQSDVKRLLAYSSIAQIGYMLVGVAAGTRLGLTGTTFHIFNHALMKGLAFLCAGAFIYRAKTRKLNELTGIGRRMPMSTIALSIALFALAGMPPLNGFMSKFVIFTAAIPVGMAWLATVGVLNSAFSVAYYLRLILVLIRSKPARKAAIVKEAPVTMLAPMCVMSALIVLFGVWTDPVLNFAQRAATCLVNRGG